MSEFGSSTVKDRKKSKKLRKILQNRNVKFQQQKKLGKRVCGLSETFSFSESSISPAENKQKGPLALTSI